MKAPFADIQFDSKELLNTAKGYTFDGGLFMRGKKTYFDDFDVKKVLPKDNTPKLTQVLSTRKLQ